MGDEKRNESQKETKIITSTSARCDGNARRDMLAKKENEEIRRADGKIMNVMKGKRCVC